MRNYYLIMLSKLLPNLNISQLFVLITFIGGLLFIDSKRENNRILLSILFVNFCTEVMSLFLIYNKHKIGLLYSLDIIVHHSLWILLLLKSIRPHREFNFIIPGFLLFGVYNLLFQEGIETFNCYTFIVGALLYIIVFIYESFAQLKKENFSFFLSNNYLLLFAPILFFFGMSFLFGFRSNSINTFLLFGNVNFYTFINLFVNVVYYSLIFVYIYNEKTKHIKHDS